MRITAVTFGKGARPSPAPSLLGENLGVRLGGLDAEINYEMNVKYEVPEGLQASVESPVFRVELRRMHRSGGRSSRRGK